MQNRAEFVRIFAQDDVQATTEFRCLDFTPMSFAHGRDLVGKKNSALEEVQFPKEFDTAQGEEPFVQIGQTKIESPETALLSNVMDRKNGRERQMVCPHINGHERGRPIMHMQNLRRGR